MIKAEWTDKDTLNLQPTCNLASNCISRQAAIDELKECRKIYCDNTPESFSLLGHSDKSRVDEIDNAIAILVNLPSAEPEIIRCKDCIYFDEYSEGIEKYQWDGFCSDWARNTYENWYCSRAERMK